MVSIAHLLAIVFGTFPNLRMLRDLRTCLRSAGSAFGNRALEMDARDEDVAHIGVDIADHAEIQARGRVGAQSTPLVSFRERILASGSVPVSFDPDAAFDAFEAAIGASSGVASVSMDVHPIARYAALTVDEPAARPSVSNSQRKAPSHAVRWYAAA